MTKRLETMLRSLESSQPSAGGISSAESKLLVSLTARRDALFWPWRYVRGCKYLPEVFRRQREYSSGEAGLQAKADGKGQWKDAHHNRQRLIAMNLISANHSGGQVTNVLLTPLGEATARALVGSRLKTLSDIEPKLMVAKIMAHQREDKLFQVRESILFGRPCIGSPSDWDDFTEWILPLLTANIVRATSDACGRVLYDILGDNPTDLEFNAVSVASSLDWDDLYIEVFDQERKTLQSVESRDPHELFIPVPASVAWLPEGGL